MTKFTQFFSRLKSQQNYPVLSWLFLLVLMCSQASWGQQPIATGQYDGGFEGATLNSAALSQTTVSTTKWSYDSANLSTSTIVSSGARSGSKAFSIVNTVAATGKYIMSPKFSPALVCGDGVSVLGENYTVQYFVKTSVAGLATKGAIYTNTRGSGAGTQGTADANGWVKVTYRYTGVVNVVAATGTWAGFGNNVTTLPFSALVDDFVVYTGVDDVTAPNAPTNLIVATGANPLVSWDAPAGGVDGGGYVVVRYATTPNADNDPNQNGIYALGNTTTNGTGSLVGTVAYIGTATSFTDTASAGSYYKVYTVDKAFNYSNEITGTGASVGTTPQAITFGALSTATYGDAAFALTGSSDSGLTVSYASSNTAVATISGNTVTIVGAGTTNITASQVGDATYAAATNVIQPLIVNTKALTLPDAVAQNKPYNGTTAAVITGTLTGIINSDAVTLNGTGTFADANVATGIAVTSTCTLTGAKAANYTLTQPTGLTADITKVNQTIAMAATGFAYSNFADYSPAASASSGLNPITYNSSNTGVATVVAGKIHFVANGITTITASQAATSNFNAAIDVVQTLTVGAPSAPKKKVLYATYNKAMNATASSYGDDPVIRMLNNENFEVTVVATDATGVNLPASFSAYDLLVVQESIGGGDNVLKASVPGKLAIKNLTIPVIYNKVFALQNTRAVSSTTSTGGTTIADTSNLSVTVDLGNQSNSLYSGINFTTTSLPLFKTLSDDTGSTTVSTKAISVAKSLELSTTGTLLASVPEVVSPNNTILINDIPAGTQFGTAVTDVCPSRMIAFGFNYGAMCESYGKNVTSELLTVWRNAAYVLTGQAVPTTLYEDVSTTWSGTAWDNGTPDSTLAAYVAGVYSTTTNGTISAKKLTVNSGKSLTVNTGTNITVQNEVINNGSLIVENDANLIQVNNVVNTGNTVVKRNSNPLYRLDYTMWSSPVASQNLLAFSPATTTTRFYNYNSSTNLYNAEADPSTTPFTVGKGYLIRMPNTDPTSNYDAGTATLAYPGVFTGVLNNGDINLTGLTAGQYVAVGNPYPSAISADSFIDANSTGAGSGTLYFWRKTNNLNQSTTPTTSYATYTKAGPVGLPAGSGTANEGFTPNGTIAVGQGFITTVPTSGTIAFTNALRSSSTTAQFLRTKALAEKSRVWLNLSEGTNPVNQMMVAYMDGATTGFDSGIDGKYINDAATALTSDIAGEEYVIQGRPTFSDTDVVNLNFKASVAGTYTIAKDHVDGLFATGQDIYLVDKTTGTETNLQKEAYTFTAAAGVNNTRFQLTYKTSASLKVNDLAFDENSISVYKQNGVLNINSGNTTMKSVKVFDVTGRLVLEQKSVNATTIALKNLATGKQALLIQITSDDNRVVTKKAIN